MTLKPVPPRRAAEKLENASGYLKDSLRRVGPEVRLPRSYVERLRRDLQRAADQLHIFANLDAAGFVRWPNEPDASVDAPAPNSSSSLEMRATGGRSL
jgi:hypothetical protein